MSSRPPSRGPERPPPPSLPPAAGGPADDGGGALGNRKLIRPSLGQAPPSTGERRARQRVVPPEATGLEAAHFHKQANLGAVLAVTLENGEVLRGTLEWYDRDCLRLRRADGTGVVVMKHAIVHSTRDENAAP